MAAQIMPTESRSHTRHIADIILFAPSYIIENNIPITVHIIVGKEVKFVGMDGMPSDHYLWLTGEAAKMLRREKPLSFEMPRRDAK